MKVAALLLRYWHTVRYLRLVQLYGRVWFRLARPRPDLSAAPAMRNTAGVWELPIQREPSMLGPEEFLLLGECGSLSKLGWNGMQRETLWRYNQHYFDDLNADGAGARTTWHRALIDHWVESNPAPQGVGWEPYPTSLRVVNWVKWALAGNVLTDRARHSLAVQARWLSRRLEYHLLGNHLFANAKALVLAGMFFRGPQADAWLVLGLRIIARELPEQVLPDGGNFERSPMYHAIFLEDLLDLINAANAWPDVVERPVADQWRAQAGRMLDWLCAMCHPDGGIAFFNDAAFGVAPTLSQLTAYAARLGLQVRAPGAVSVPVTSVQQISLMRLSDSGYVRIDWPDAVALIDVALIGPDYLPAHAHADTLSFELSIFGRRVFVNSGTSCYGTSAERIRQRGTAAHNTVVVDGQDSSEVWGGFRVARRAYPLVEEFDSSSGAPRVAARHSGYQSLAGRNVHRREWQPRQGMLCIRDVVSGRYRNASARLHVHPDLRFGRVGDVLGAKTDEGHVIEMRFEPIDGVRIEASTWHPAFGQSVDNQCIVVDIPQGGLLTSISWSVR